MLSIFGEICDCLFCHRQIQSEQKSRAVHSRKSLDISRNPVARVTGPIAKTHKKTTYLGFHNLRREQQNILRKKILSFTKTVCLYYFYL